MRKIILPMLLAASFAATACNTIEGIGQDVESVGETVEDAAN